MAQPASGGGAVAAAGAGDRVEDGRPAGLHVRFASRSPSTARRIVSGNGTETGRRTIVVGALALAVAGLAQTYRADAGAYRQEQHIRTGIATGRL